MQCIILALSVKRLCMICQLEVLMKNCLRFLFAACIFTGIASAAENVWITDMTMAKQKAAAGNKDILIYITGSDWCGF